MSQYKIALHGLETRTAERFRNLFLINFRGKYSITDSDDQDIDLVDIDLCQDSSDLLGRLSPRRTILLSESERLPEGFSGLQKPAKINELAMLLDQAVAGKLQSNTVSTAPRKATNYQSNSLAISEQLSESADIADFKTLRLLDSSERYEADDFFLALFLQAYDKAATCDYVELRNWNNERFIMSRRYNVLYCDISKNQFRNIASIAVPQQLRAKANITTLADLPPAAELDVMYQQSLERALWKLAYGTSRGRLPHNLGSTQQYSLKKWPNFTRLPRMKNGMRMAAIWTGNTMSPVDVATQLQIDLAEVHAFLVACHALGLLHENQQASSKPVRASRSNKIFNSLLGHLSAAFSGNKQRHAS